MEGEGERTATEGRITAGQSHAASAQSEAQPVYADRYPRVLASIHKALERAQNCSTVEAMPRATLVDKLHGIQTDHRLRLNQTAAGSAGSGATMICTR